MSTLLGFFSSFPKITGTFREVWFSCIWFYFSQGKIRYVISTCDTLGNTLPTQPRIKIWMLCAHLKPLEGFSFVFWRHLSSQVPPIKGFETMSLQYAASMDSSTSRQLDSKSATWGKPPLGRPKQPTPNTSVPGAAHTWRPSFRPPQAPGALHLELKF